MDFEHDDEQSALREAAAALLNRSYGGDQRRSVTATEPGYDEKTWAQLAEMGVLGLPFTEADGGMGAGDVEVALVANEIGKVLAPEPFVESVVLAGGLVAAVGTDAQRSEVLGALAEGSSLLILAHAEPGTRWATTAAGVTATRDGEGWRLDGVKEPVQHGAHADLLVVSAAVEGRTQLFLVPGDAEGLTRTGYRTHDSGRAAKLTFAATPATLLGDGDADRSDDLAHALARAQVAYCHEAVGAMSTALTMTSEYLKTRKQFGVTLNKFQALTFRAADMYVSLELVRSVVLWATMVIADGSTDTSAVMAADRARLQTSKASKHIGQEAIQLHGGIGMTAEYKLGHYTSRLTALEHILGDGDRALGHLADNVESYETVEALP
ncbi:MAG: acyl-CoA dehydrogenase family protein [Mycobacteriaceae bacterium]